jgi:uncharacterized protein YndB with AHSA1/START domain
MKSKHLELKTALQILKPVNEVFEAIIDPYKMSRYFISKSDGIMQEGKTVTWEFPEFEGTWPVRIEKVEKDKYISFYWEGATGHDLKVEMHIEARENNTTLVTITEGHMKNDEDGIKWLLSNTEGWTNFLCCLKAYLEYGINLRKGGYDYLLKNKQNEKI